MSIIRVTSSRGNKMPSEGKPETSNSFWPIKRRTFLGFGLSGFAGCSLPGWPSSVRRPPKYQKNRRRGNSNRDRDDLWGRSERYEEKMTLLEAAWQRKDFRLARLSRIRCEAPQSRRRLTRRIAALEFQAINEPGPNQRTTLTPK